MSEFFVAIIFLIIGLSAGSIFSEAGAKELRDACEKDLARNLKCEMVYVKPSIKEGE